MSQPASDDLGGLSQADAIRRALDAIGRDDVGAAVAWLAEHGRPGIARQRVYDVLARDGRPVGRPKPPAPPGAPAARKHRGPSAAAEHGRLGHSWAAETPPARWPNDLEGEHHNEVCGDCGGPLHWTGARTALICPACRLHGRSGEAKERAADVADSWAPKRHAAGPSQAERDAAAREAHTDRAELLRLIASWRPDKRLSDRARDVLDWYAAEARKTADLPPEAAIDRLGDLGDQLADEQLPHRWRMLPPITLGQLADADEAEAAAELQTDHGDQGESNEGDDDEWRDDRADRVARMIGDIRAQAREARQIEAGPLGGYATLPAAFGPYCEPCRAQRRMTPEGTYRPAAALAEWPDMVPAPRDLCGEHLADAIAQLGAQVVAHRWYAAAPPEMRLAYESQRRAAIGARPLTAAELLRVIASPAARNGGRRP